MIWTLVSILILIIFYLLHNNSELSRLYYGRNDSITKLSDRINELEEEVRFYRNQNSELRSEVAELKKMKSMPHNNTGDAESEIAF